MKAGSGKLPALVLGLSLFLYVLLLAPFTGYMSRKPIEEKLGFVPSAQVIRPLSAGMRELAGAGLMMKVIMYFGGVTDENVKRVRTVMDVEGMARMLQGAAVLDPYNMDVYYFSQAFMAWDAGKLATVNAMLDKGMEYRTWDWYLPYFAGFNHAYFLKDYKKAAAYFKRAADLSGFQLFAGLAGRYMQQSGQTELAISYLKGMVATARGELAKKTYATRLRAFEEVLEIEKARDRFVAREGRLPKDVDELLRTGMLQKQPVDPYGGTFLLNPDGKVTATSKFAFAPSVKKEAKKP